MSCKLQVLQEVDLFSTLCNLIYYVLHSLDVSFLNFMQTGDVLWCYIYFSDYKVKEKKSLEPFLLQSERK
ncbi:hypothetical protein RJT34_31262 [Clitoria ternatea]|uniref:Uncharacterized protein n=1 Tax=Clitoria ternatea TaxID=43366 RepID=A0AAN9EUZ6_CLITE